MSALARALWCRLMHRGTETTETTISNSGGVIVARLATSCLTCGRRLS